MGSAALVWLWVLAAVVLANWPFTTRKVFGLWRKPSWGEGAKPVAWHLLELLVLYTLLLGFGFLLENGLGQIAPQRWEFYAVTVSLFLTLAFPGFVGRFLLKSRGG